MIEDYRVCHTADEVWDPLQDLARTEEICLMDIDGAVVKIKFYR